MAGSARGDAILVRVPRRRCIDSRRHGPADRALRRARSLPERLHRRPHPRLRPQGKFHHHRRRRLGERRSACPHRGDARVQHRCRRAAAEVPQLPAPAPHRGSLLRAQGPLAFLLGALGHGGRGGAGGRRRLRHPHRHLPRLRERRRRLRHADGHPRRGRRGRRRGVGAAGAGGGAGARTGPGRERQALRHPEGRGVARGSRTDAAARQTRRSPRSRNPTRATWSAISSPATGT